MNDNTRQGKIGWRRLWAFALPALALAVAARAPGTRGQRGHQEPGWGHGLGGSLRVLDVAEPGGARALQAGVEAPSLVVDVDGDAVSASDGKTSLREALAYAAVLGGSPTVSFDAAFFASPRTIVLGSEISIVTPVAIVGPGASTCTISGNDTSRIFSIAAAAGEVSISNIRLSNGVARGAEATAQDVARAGRGGAIFNEARLSLREVTLENNLSVGGDREASEAGASGDGLGGAVYNAGSLTMRDCRVSGNFSSGGLLRYSGWASSSYPGVGRGAGVYNTGDVALVSSELSSNSAQGGPLQDNTRRYDASGGALFNSAGATARIEGCTLRLNQAQAIYRSEGGAVTNRGTLRVSASAFSGNEALDAGGAIANPSGNAAIEGSSFSGNISKGIGGAISNAISTDSYDPDSPSAVLSVRGCTLENNTGRSGGGIFNGARMSLLSSTLSGNQAGSGGGAITETRAVSDIANCTLHLNSATEGGGLSSRGRTSLRACTLVGNSATYFGGGLQGHGDLTLDGTLIALNSAQYGPDVAASLSSRGHNLIGLADARSTGWKSSDLLGTPAAPLSPGVQLDAQGLPALTDNGGSVKTVALTAQSPALDAGAVLLDEDARGLARPSDSSAPNAPSGDGSDIGAVEMQAPVLDLNGSAPGQNHRVTLPAGASPQVACAPDALLTDADSLALSGATVVLSAAPDGVAESLSADTSGTSIVALYEAASRTLSLSGRDTLGKYLQVLQTVSYRNTAASPDLSARSVSFSVSDGVVGSAPVRTVLALGSSALSISEIADRTIDEDAQSEAIAFSVAGASSSEDVEISVSSSNPALLPVAGITLGGTGEQRTLRAAPAANAFGASTVTVRARSQGEEVEESFVLRVRPINDAPVAGDDLAKTPEDQPLSVNVVASLLANDTDADGDTLIMKGMSWGSLQYGSGYIENGVLVFRPRENFHGTASFTYTISDGVQEVMGKVTIQVASVNDAPVASDIAVAAGSQSEVSVPLLQNASDVDGDALSATAIEPVGEVGGSFQKVGNALVFRPFAAAAAPVAAPVAAPARAGLRAKAAAASVPQQARFRYSVSDGAASASAEISINFLGGGPKPTPTPIPPATPDPTATPGATATPIATATPVATATPIATATPAPTISLSLAASTCSEADAGRGRVVRARLSRSASGGALAVALASSDASEARVPALATIPAGQNSVEFLILPVDDRWADGAQALSITASTPGMKSASARLVVLDDERPALTIAVAPGRVSENGRTVTTITISRNSEVTPLTPALRVGLSASMARQLKMPLSVVIPAQARGVRLTITGLDDALANGPRQVLVTASATGFASARAGLIVTDDEAASRGVISGRILLAPRLLVGARGVQATLRRGGAILDVAHSDASGSFRFVGLPPGSYTISVEAVGFAFVPASRPVQLSVPSLGAPSASVSFTALPRAAITAFSPGLGRVGSTVIISGLNFERASWVKFGGVSSRFTLVSPTQIRAVVPPSAPSGRITIATPQGAATSLTDFFPTAAS